MVAFSAFGPLIYDTISQTLATQPAKEYTLSFELNNAETDSLPPIFKRSGLQHDGRRCIGDQPLLELLGPGEPHTHYDSVECNRPDPTTLASRGTKPAASTT